ncbi:MAG: NUDIX hydrolase [Firmicutes bacterium]|nr:NUDIX hydrolase [Bacillota bacterium]
MDDDVNAFVQWRHAPSGEWRYCPLCRGALINHPWDGKMRRYCPECGFVYWERPLPAVAALIVRPGPPMEMVLVRRRYPPEVGQWTLPGGGIEAGESVVQAIRREVEEETGLFIEVDEQLGTWSTPSNETIITFFVAHPVSGILQAGTDALEADWFPLDKLPLLAFSTHRDAVTAFLQKRGLNPS